MLAAETTTIEIVAAVSGAVGGLAAVAACVLAAISARSANRLASIANEQLDLLKEDRARKAVANVGVPQCRPAPQAGFVGVLSVNVINVGSLDAPDALVEVMVNESVEIVQCADIDGNGATPVLGAVAKVDRVLAGSQTPIRSNRLTHFLTLRRQTPAPSYYLLTFPSPGIYDVKYTLNHPDLREGQTVHIEIIVEDDSDSGIALAVVVLDETQAGT